VARHRHEAPDLPSLDAIASCATVAELVSARWAIDSSSLPLEDLADHRGAVGGRLRQLVDLDPAVVDEVVALARRFDPRGGRRPPDAPAWGSLDDARAKLARCAWRSAVLCFEGGARAVGPFAVLHDNATYK
jgi:hypothetical protein